MLWESYCGGTSVHMLNPIKDRIASFLSIDLITKPQTKTSCQSHTRFYFLLLLNNNIIKLCHSYPLAKTGADFFTSSRSKATRQSFYCECAYVFEAHAVQTHPYSVSDRQNVSARFDFGLCLSEETETFEISFTKIVNNKRTNQRRCISCCFAY